MMDWPLKRSRARAVALQLLFQRDNNAGIERAALEHFAAERLHPLGDPEILSFCLGLYDGVIDHLEDIDRRLGEAAENWRLPRMAAVDRNVLRLGSYETSFRFRNAARRGHRRGHRAGPAFRLSRFAGFCQRRARSTAATAATTANSSFSLIQCRLVLPSPCSSAKPLDERHPAGPTSTCTAPTAMAPILQDSWSIWLDGAGWRPFP